MKRKIIKKATLKKVQLNAAKPTKRAVATKQPNERKLSTIGDPMSLNEIEELIKFVAKSGVSEVELQNKDFKLIIKTQNGNVANAAAPVVTNYIPAPAPAVTIPQPQSNGDAKKEAAAPVLAAKTENLITVKSPMIGTFYRSSGPDKPLFVNVGDEIKEGKVLCIIEAMKLFNEIESEVTGRIVKILVDDATPVEYDQPLFLVEPA